MNLEGEKTFLIHFLYLALILFLGFISIKYILPMLAPFVIGFMVAALLNPFIDKIEKSVKLKRSFISIIILLLFYGILVLLTSLFGVKLFSFLQNLFYQLPKLYENTLQPSLDSIVNSFLMKFPEIEVHLEDIFNSISDSVFSFLTNVSSTLVGTITGFASQIPSILIKFLFTIVSSFFFTIDYHVIKQFIVRQIPEKKKKLLLNIKKNGIGTIFKFIKGYLTLMIISFVELSIGFWILGISNAFLIGFLVALIDILPILGTGGVLIPWAIISFIFGKTSLGIGMLILYVVITIIRQILEPKIVGKQIGLHPAVTLICMFVGAQLFGILGLFLFPVLATLLKGMNDEGTLQLFK